MKYNPLLGDLNECIERSKPIVYKFANRYAAAGKQVGLDYDDLLQEGYIGLLRAYQRYDGRAQWSTFAFICVRTAIQKAVLSSDAGATYSRPLKELAIIARRECISDVHELRERFGCTEKAAKSLQDYLLYQHPLHLHDPFLDDEELTWMRVIGANDDHTGCEVDSFLLALSARERTVLRMRMEGYKQREIAAVIGVSQVQVSRIEARIRAKAGAYFAA